jgi:hypothetical protein
MSDTDQDLWAAIQQQVVEDPDAALALIEKSAEAQPEMRHTVPWTYCAMIAHLHRGLGPMLEAGLGLATRPLEAEQLAGLLDESRLDDLERCLDHARGLDEIDSDFLTTADSQGVTVEDLVDQAAVAVERCRPGAVLPRLGRMKLGYLDLACLKAHDDTQAYLSPEVLWKRIAVDRPIRSALFRSGGEDGEGRYVDCLLFGRPFSELGPEDTLEAADPIGTVRLYN